MTTSLYLVAHNCDYGIYQLMQAGGGPGSREISGKFYRCRALGKGYDTIHFFTGMLILVLVVVTGVVYILNIFGIS